MADKKSDDKKVDPSLKPSNELPSTKPTPFPPTPDNTLPTPEPPPVVDNTLPEELAKPDNELPEVVAPKSKSEVLSIVGALVGNTSMDTQQKEKFLKELSKAL